MHSHLGLHHCHRVGHHASDSTGGSLEIQDLGSFIWLPSVHRRLVRCSLLLLELNVSRNVVGLSAEELLLVLFGVEDRGVEALHLFLSENELAQVLSVLPSLFCEPGMLRRFGSINLLGLQNHFVESRDAVSRSASEYAVLH